MTGDLEAKMINPREKVLYEGLQIVEQWLFVKYDRMKYYGEGITPEDMEFILGELRRIERDVRQTIV
jgi:hypothetical protein